MINYTSISGRVRTQHPIEPVADGDVNMGNGSPAQEALEPGGNAVAEKPTGHAPKLGSLLTGLPMELKHAVMREVFYYPGTRKDVDDLSALQLASQSLREALRADGVLFAEYHQVKGELRQIRRFADALSVPELIKFSGKALFEMASRRKQKACVDHVLNDEIMGSEYGVDHLVTVSRGLSSLEHVQRQRLIQAAMAVDGESAALICKTIQHWGPDMRFLTTAQRTLLIDKILRSGQAADDIACCINRLGTGLHTFEVNLYNRLVDTVVCMGVPLEKQQALAIQGLGDGLAGLDGDRGTALVMAALKMTDQGSKSKAIMGLGQKIQTFGDEQRHALVDSVSKMTNALGKSFAIGGLARGLPALNALRYTEALSALIDATETLAEERHKYYAIAALGAVLKFPTTPKHMECNERIFAIIVQQIERDEGVGIAWIHIGESLQALTPLQHETLFEIALNLPAEGHSNRALYNLIKGLPAFTPELKNTWLSHYLGEAKGSNLQLIYFGRALGGYIRAFNDTQQAALVDTALNVTNEEHRSAAIAGVCFVESPKQRRRLLEAALALTDDYDKSVAMAGVAEAYNFSVGLGWESRGAG